jgi:hypothetical protein
MESIIFSPISSPGRMSSFSWGGVLHFPGGVFSIPQKKYHHLLGKLSLHFFEDKFFFPEESLSPPEEESS